MMGTGRRRIFSQMPQNELSIVTGNCTEPIQGQARYHTNLVVSAGNTTIYELESITYVTFLVKWQMRVPTRK